MTYILIYSATMILAVVLYEHKKSQTDDHFLVANRSVQGLSGSMSIAASWIWAPALFVSTQVGYQWGYSGLFWFTVPNVLALIIFAPFAAKVRNKIPNGYSYIQYIHKDGELFRYSQLSVQLGVQIVAFAIQITAGAELIALITGASYSWVVIIITVAPLAYTLLSGLSSSIFTDAIQFVLIVLAIAIIFLELPAWEQIPTDYTFEFLPFNNHMLIQFGLASALALIFGIFADHQQWQRAFAIQRTKVVRTYIGAGLLHGLVTFSLGTLGVVIAAIGFESANLQLVGADYIRSNMPVFFSVVFTFMALCGLCSTLDSCFSAFGGLISTEFSSSATKKPVARKAMILLALLGLLLGLSRVPVITLWLLAGILRLVSVTPTLLSVFSNRFSGTVGSLAMLIGLLLGAPLFIYGSVYRMNEVRTLGMLLCLGMSALTCFVGSKLQKNRKYCNKYDCS